MKRDVTTECTVEKGISIRRLNHWSEYFELIRTQHANAPAYIYRGQGYDWPLLSTLDRLEARFPTKRNFGGGVPEAFDVPPASRSQHLEAFKESARARAALDATESDDEWWALARHHGLATPIMDWTYSPFVALFFAFEDQRITDGGQLKIPDWRVVLRVSWHLLAGDDGRAEDPPRAFVPRRALSQRMLNQESVCVMMPQGIELSAFVRKQFADESSTTKPVWARAILEKIEINNSERRDCLKFLNKMRVNRLTMFPDLDGSAQYVNALWELDFDTSLGSINSRQ